MLSSVQTPFNEYTADGSTTQFTTTFAVFRAADLRVFFDNVEQFNFTVSDLGVIAGATFTFESADKPGAGVIVYAELDPLYTRDTEYQTNGDILAATLNRDFDRIWNALQAVMLPAVSSSNAVTTATSAAGVLTIDLALGDYFLLPLTENIGASWVISNPDGAGYGRTIMVEIHQHASSAKTVAWPTSFTWAGGSAGTVSTTPGDIDVLAMTTFDNGTTWRATLAKGFA